MLLESDSGWRLRITSIETIPFGAADFRRPTADEIPERALASFGRASDEESLPLERKRWRRPSANRFERHSPTTCGRRRPQPYLRIQGAPSRALAFGNMWGFVRGDDPPEGWLYTSGSLPVGFTVVQGTYVTIRASSAELLLAAARALEPAR